MLFKLKEHLFAFKTFKIPTSATMSIRIFKLDTIQLINPVGTKIKLSY